MSEASEKGKALERGVRFIQETILRNHPQLKGQGFTIESNVIREIAGVRYEIDIFIKTLPDSSFEALYIFECKNWKAPVGKNEVICFADKIAAVGASKGYMVARQFTSDARARAG